MALKNRFIILFYIKISLINPRYQITDDLINYFSIPFKSIIVFKFHTNELLLK